MHFFCVQDVASVEEEDEDTTPTPAAVKKNDALDSIFAGIKESTSTIEPSISKVEVKEDKPAVDDTDAKLKELLASL